MTSLDGRASEAAENRGSRDATVGVGTGKLGLSLPLAARRVLPPTSREVVRAFRAAGVDRRAAPRDHALRVDHPDGTIDYYVAAAAAGGVCGWRQVPNDEWVARATETPVASIDTEAARPVSVVETPAWCLAHEPAGIGSSWHARVRWGERVEETPAAGRAIARAWREAVVKTADGDEQTRQHAGHGVRLVGDVGGETPTVVTVY